MSLRKQLPEIRRLISAFSKEAEEFHDISFRTYSISKTEEPPSDKFSSPNHAVMLWQYYGEVNGTDGAETLLADLKSSDMKWGVRGAELTSFGVIQGPTTPLFIRMAKRAGNLFNDKEAATIKSRTLDDIRKIRPERTDGAKSVGAVNDNHLAIWLNYLLFFVSLTNPSRKYSQRIEPDPFTLSLLALERLGEDPTIEKVDRSISPIEEISFKIAISFSGDKRTYVSRVVEQLRHHFQSNAIFYDYDFQAQLARPDLDLLLTKIYRDNSELLVVFLSAEYAEREWCGIEWRIVRDILKSKQGHRIMLVKFDDAHVEGLLSIDGYIDGRKYSEIEIARLVLERYATL